MSNTEASAQTKAIKRLVEVLNSDDNVRVFSNYEGLGVDK